MKKQKIVIALGGNALGNNLPEQMVAVKSTAKAIVDLIEEGHQVVISHGNGPQVGMINIAMAELSRLYPNFTVAPMSVCVGMSQGYIGYDLQNSIRAELLNRGLEIPVSTIITQVVVDENDPAFLNPTKPIGRFMTYEEAQEQIAKGNKVTVEMKNIMEYENGDILCYFNKGEKGKIFARKAIFTEKSRNEIMLIPINSEYQTKTVQTTDIVILGKAKQVIADIA